MKKRKFEEGKEGLETIKNEAPEARFQNEQQVQNTMDAADAKGVDSSFKLKKDDVKGSQLKQERISEVIKDASFGGSNSGMGISAGGRSVSGTSGGVLGSTNGTPIARKSRSDERYGKKLDRLATKLNFTPSEQILVSYDESKPLADAADQDQGFNGTYRNEYARSQKVAGNTPAELLYDRSIDLILKDQLYFGQGQYVKQTGVTYNDTPTIKVVKNAKGAYEYPVDSNTQTDVVNYKLSRGNFLHNKMHVKFDNTGRVIGLTFDVTDLDASADADSMNKSAVNGAIDRNYAEIDRQRMDEKAGDEKADVWSPLPRAIKQPTQVVGLLRDFEAITGNEAYLAYKKLSSSMSYQLNRGVKDGQSVVDPGVEALYGVLKDANSYSVIKNDFTSLKSLLDGSAAVAAWKKGCSSLMIAAYDSANKYKTKQDILLQPRSFRMHLQTADNNMNPLKVNKRFAQIVDACETFSTIDREYDPMLPICMTDKAAIITSYNFNDLAARQVSGYSHEVSKAISGGTDFVPTKIFDGRLNAHQDLNLKYYVHFLLDDNSVGHGGFTTKSIDGTTCYVLNTSTDKNSLVYILINTDSTTYTTGKTINGTTYYEHQAAVATTASTDMYYAYPEDDEDSYQDDWSSVLLTPLYGGAYRYMYSDLRNNYAVTVGLPLIDGIVDYFEKEIGAQLYRLTGGEIDIPMVHSTQYFSLWSAIVCAATPFIGTSRINSMRDVIYYEQNVEYPFPQLISIKDASLKSYTNFGFTDYDSPLECKPMLETTAIKWVMPETFWVISRTITNSRNVATNLVMPFYFNEKDYNYDSNGQPTINNDESNFTFPSIRSGARLSFLDKFYGMTEKDIRLCYDRVIPFIPSKMDTSNPQFVYKYGQNTDGTPGFALADDNFADISIKEWLSQPRELGWVIDAPYGLLTTTINSENHASESDSATRGNSFRIKYWLNSSSVTHTTGSGSEDILKVDAVNINRAANFSQVWFEIVANGKRPDFDHGFVASLNHLFSNGGNFEVGNSVFKPFYNEGTSNVISAGSARSLMKGMWTRIQKLPFVLSPFDCEDRSSSSNVSIDPFEMAYYFGLCGFRASDYRESVYNREKEYVNQGFLFVNDPWIDASPLFKEGSIANGIKVAKGYEM